MQRLSRLTLLACTVPLALAGCLSSHPGSSSMAYVDIEKSSAAVIREHAVRVFGAEGYQLTGEAAGKLEFERNATAQDLVLYGTPGVRRLVMRVVVIIEPGPEHEHLVRADAYAVRDGLAEPLLRMSRRQYQSLLRRVRASVAEAGA